MMLSYPHNKLGNIEVKQVQKKSKEIIERKNRVEHMRLWA